MAGDWIKMSTGLQTHPKVVRISSAFNADRLRVVGALHAVWSIFDEHSTDGSLPGYTPEILDNLVGLSGISEQLLAVGWLENDKRSGLTLPRFDSHNGASAKRRAQELDRKRRLRNGPQNVPIETGQVSASNADKKRTREEKRRVLLSPIGERGETDIPAKPKPSKKAPKAFAVTDAMREWAAQNAPAVDIEAETEKLRDHEFATPRSDWLGTWRNWLRKASEFTPRNGNGTHHAAALPWQDTKDGVINRACALVLREYDGIEPWERYRRHVIEEDAKRRQAA